MEALDHITSFVNAILSNPAVFIVFLLLTGFWLWMLLDDLFLVRGTHQRHVWAAVIVLLWVVGAWAYFFRVYWPSRGKPREVGPDVPLTEPGPGDFPS